jgi:hypothetical protein
MKIGFAHDPAALIEKSSHDLRVPPRRRCVGETRAAHARREALDIDGVLHSHPQAVAAQIQHLRECEIGTHRPTP